MWDRNLINPLSSNRNKPRSSGITMVMDKGLGNNFFQDLVETGHEHMDFIKLGFGTSGITPIEILKRKIYLATEFNIPLYPGGTFFEVAKTQEKVHEYFKTLRALGFKWVEISDGSILLPADERRETILLAQEYGFNVITEIGKKDSHTKISFDFFLELYHQDISSGSSYVIVEGRETGDNLVVFNESKTLDTDFIRKIQESIGMDQLIWEAPQKKQQIELLHAIGSKVNFGNIAPNDVLSVESLRRGLRSDTFPNFLCSKGKL